MASGYVKSLHGDQWFGFVAVQPGTRDAFFHSNSLRGGLEFCPQLQGRRVTFDLRDNARGLEAVNVRPVK